MKSAQAHFSCQDLLLRSELFSVWQELPCPRVLSYANAVSVLLPSLKDVG